MEIQMSAGFKSLTAKETLDIDGGLVYPWIKVVIGVAVAYVAVYEAGKGVGETIYYLTH